MEQFVASFAQFGLPGIFFLMALESSLFPIPSELVMIPAGYLAYQGHISAPLAILAGGLWSLFGAWWNYLLGKYVGKVFLERYGRYFLITHEKYDKAERLFMRNDRLYTFLGRFIPVVRHLISIPAGIFRMNPWWFSGLTFVGATIWCAILTGVGYYVGPSVLELARTYSHEANIIAIVLIFAGALWFIVKK